MLATSSEENGFTRFGLDRRKIKLLPSKQLKMPHMGWNSVRPTKNNNLISGTNDYYFTFLLFYCKNNENILTEVWNEFYFNCWKEKYIWRSVSSEKVPPRIEQLKTL